MKQFALTLLTTLVVGTAYAASHTGAAPMPEAMKPGNTQAEDAAQKSTDEKSKMGAAASGPMPEAMKPGNEKSEAAADTKTKAKPKVGKAASTDEQMSNDAKKQ